MDILLSIWFAVKLFLLGLVFIHTTTATAAYIACKLGVDRPVLRWYALTLPWFWVNFIAYFGAPFIALFYEYRDGPINNNNGTGVEPRLPSWLSWFETFDNSLLGDAAWKNMEENHWAWRVKFAAYPKLMAYLGRVGWLQRNPAYGFERTVLAAFLKKGDVVTYEGDPFIQDQPNGKPGKCIVSIGKYWNFNAIIPAGESCIKLTFGWKLKTHAERALRDNLVEIQEDTVAQFAVGVGLKKYTPV